MAYADKSTDMRRCCLAKGGHVQWEGVEIDGCRYLLRNRTSLDEIGATAYLTKKKLIDTLKYFNDNLMDHEDPMVLLFQDSEDCGWSVVDDYYKLQDKNKKTLSLKNRQ